MFHLIAGCTVCMSQLLFVKSKWITGTLLKAFKSGQINRFMMATDLVFLEKENSTTLVYDVLGSFKKSKQTLCSMIQLLPNFTWPIFLSLSCQVLFYNSR